MDPWTRGSSSFSKRMMKKRVRGLSSISWDEEEPEHEPDECSLGRLLIPGIDYLEHSVSGLDLEDMPGSGLCSSHRKGLELQEV